MLKPLAPTLKMLNLGGNKLGGTITDDIAAFTKLAELRLSGMDLKGTFVDTRARSAPATRWKRIGDFPRVPRSHEERRSSQRSSYRDTCSETFCALPPCSPLSRVPLFSPTVTEEELQKLLPGCSTIDV